MGLAPCRFPKKHKERKIPKRLRLHHRNTSINISGWCENWQSSTEMSGKKNHHCYHLCAAGSIIFCIKTSLHFFIKGKGLMIRWFCMKEIYLNVLRASRSSLANLDFPQQMDGLGTYIFLNVSRTWIKIATYLSHYFNLFQTICFSWKRYESWIWVSKKVWILEEVCFLWKSLDASKLESLKPMTFRQVLLTNYGWSCLSLSEKKNTKPCCWHLAYHRLGGRCIFSIFSIPSWELTYALKNPFWRWLSFSPGGIC